MFLEPVKPNYIYVDPITNHVHLFVQFYAIEDRISRDNTCRTYESIKDFFGLYQNQERNQKSALNECIRYQQALERDIAGIPDDTSDIKIKKQSRLTQINHYITALEILKDHPQIRNLQTFPSGIKNLLQRKSNVYAMQLRPEHMDGYEEVVAPVFSLNRQRGDTNNSLFYRSLRTEYRKQFTVGAQKGSMSSEELQESFINGVVAAINPQPNQAINLPAIAAQMSAQMLSRFGKQNVNFTIESVEPGAIKALKGYQIAQLTPSTALIKPPLATLGVYWQNHELHYAALNHLDQVVQDRLSAADLHRIITAPRLNINDIDNKIAQVRNLLNNYEIVFVSELPDDIKPKTLYLRDPDPGLGTLRYFAQGENNKNLTGNIEKALLGRVLCPAPNDVENLDFKYYEMFSPEIIHELKQRKDHTFLENTFATKESIDAVGEPDSTSSPLDLVKFYVTALISFCQPHIFTTLSEPNSSPFYAIEDINSRHENSVIIAKDKLSIMTQFFMAEVNIHCVAYNICTENTNFGRILDGNSSLCSQIALAVKAALQQGNSVETALLMIIEANAPVFNITPSAFTDAVKRTIVENFKADFGAISKSPHFDEFTIIDLNKKGDFVSHQSALCVDFAKLVAEGFPNVDNDYFREIRAHNDVMMQNLPTAKVPHQNLHIQTAFTLNIPVVFQEKLAQCNGVNFDALVQFLLADANANQKVFQVLEQAQIEQLTQSPHWRGIRRAVAARITNPAIQQAFNRMFLGAQAQLTLTREMLKNLCAATVHREGYEPRFNYKKDTDIRAMLNAWGISDEVTVETGHVGGFVLTGWQEDIQIINDILGRNQNKFYLSPELTRAIYQEVGDRNPTAALLMKSLPEGSKKLNTALQLLDISISVRAITYPANCQESDAAICGYIITAKPEITYRIEDIYAGQIATQLAVSISLSKNPNELMRELKNLTQQLLNNPVRLSQTLMNIKAYAGRLLMWVQDTQQQARQGIQEIARLATVLETTDPSLPTFNQMVEGINTISLGIEELANSGPSVMKAGMNVKTNVLWKSTVTSFASSSSSSSASGIDPNILPDYQLTEEILKQILQFGSAGLQVGESRESDDGLRIGMTPRGPAIVSDNYCIINENGTLKAISKTQGPLTNEPHKVAIDEIYATLLAYRRQDIEHSLIEAYFMGIAQKGLKTKPDYHFYINATWVYSNPNQNSQHPFFINKDMNKRVEVRIDGSRRALDVYQKDRKNNWVPANSKEREATLREVSLGFPILAAKLQDLKSVNVANFVI